MVYNQLLKTLISGANCSTRKTKNLWKKDSECYIWKKLRVEKPNYWFELKRIWATFCWIFSSMTRWMWWNAKIICNLVAFQILPSKVLIFVRQIFMKYFIKIFEIFQGYPKAQSLCWSKLRTHSWQINLKKKSKKQWILK